MSEVKYIIYWEGEKLGEMFTNGASLCILFIFNDYNNAKEGYVLRKTIEKTE